MSKLTDIEIQGEIQDLNGWEFKENAIRKTFSFESYMDSIEFINRLAVRAEEANHHPELFNVYSRVTIDLTTHDAGNKVTQKDTDLAEVIENIATKRR